MSAAPLNVGAEQPDTLRVPNSNPETRRAPALDGVARRAGAALALLALCAACSPHARWQALRDELRALASKRASVERPDGRLDLRGAIHVHSHLSHDSDGQPEELLAAAHQAELDFFVLTDHDTPAIFTEGLQGRYDDVLVIRGMEIIKGPCVFASRCAALLAVGIHRYFDPGPLSPEQIVAEIRAQGGLAFVAHPRGWRDWSNAGITGLEIYDILDDAVDEIWRAPKLFFDVLHSHDRYGDEVFLQIQDRPHAHLRTWDRLATTRRLVGVAGNDAHQNTRVLRHQLDPYARSLRFVTTHVLAASHDEPGVLDALSSGHAYVAFDSLADATGFRFETADVNPGVIQGDEIALRPPLRLRARAPLEGRIRLLRDGELVAECTCLELAHEVMEPGAHRIEVSLEIQGSWRPWIFSNPIYVR